jgi:hypothetical protein
MRVTKILRNAALLGAACVAARVAGADGGSGGSGGSPRPFPELENWNPLDQSPAALVAPCNDPGHCPPIHDAVVVPNGDDYAMVPYMPELAGPNARVFAGHSGALLADPSFLQARRDPQAWSLFDTDQSGFGQGTRLHVVGSTHFGERLILVQSSPASPLVDPEIDKRGDAIVMAAPFGPAVGRAAALGVWYDGATWWAYNEDGTKLPAGERVLYFDAADKGGRATHVAANDFGGIGIVLDDPRLNGKPQVVVIAQHVFEQVRNASPLATFYDKGQARWIVYNADGSQLALDETVHFIVGP